MDNKWGHVSLSFLWHSVQLGFGCVSYHIYIKVAKHMREDIHGCHKFSSSYEGIWVNQPIHSFLVGCLNPCLQGTSVQIVKNNGFKTKIDGPR